MPVTRLCFICSGNICRSPFAEELAKKKLPEFANLKSLQIISRGLSATPGLPADESAQRISKQFGVDLSNHRTAQFSPDEIGGGDLLLIMDQFHAALIQPLGREIASKTILLGSFFQKDGHKLIISDPWGKPDSEFGQCFEQISTAVTRLLTMLDQRANGL